MTFDDRNTGILTNLDPVAREKFRVFLKYLEGIGEDILITDGKRTPAQQDELFKSGRTIPGPIKTNVKGNRSYHVWGVAIDIALVTKGQPHWDDFSRYQKIAMIAEEIGIVWGQRIWSDDEDHFQYTQGLTIDDLIKGARLKEEPIPIINYSSLVNASAVTLGRLEARVGSRFGPMVLGKFIAFLKSFKRNS